MGAQSLAAGEERVPQSLVQNSGVACAALGQKLAERGFDDSAGILGYNGHWVARFGGRLGWANRETGIPMSANAETESRPAAEEIEQV